MAWFGWWTPRIGAAWLIAPRCGRLLEPVGQCSIVRVRLSPERQGPGCERQGPGCAPDVLAATLAPCWAWAVPRCGRPAAPQELGKLLLEERLAGATLLIMANKQDVPGALGADAIREVCSCPEAQPQTQASCLWSAKHWWWKQFLIEGCLAASSAPVGLQRSSHKNLLVLPRRP